MRNFIILFLIVFSTSSLASNVDKYSDRFTPSLSSFVSIHNQYEPHVDQFWQSSVATCPQWPTYTITLHRPSSWYTKQFSFLFQLPDGLVIDSVSSSPELRDVSFNSTGQVVGEFKDSRQWGRVEVSIRSAAVDVDGWVSLYDIQVNTYSNLYLRKKCSSNSNVVSGVVFEDYDFSGGVSTYHPDEMYELKGIDVELVDEYGDVIAQDTTDSNGLYEMSDVSQGRYYVRLAQDSTFKTFRDVNGSKCANGKCLPVIVSPWVRSHLQTDYVEVSGAVQVNVGINYNTVTNNQDSGPGSLRQVLQNLSYLNNDSALTQKCKNCEDGKDNVVFSLESLFNSTIEISSSLQLSVNPSGQDDTYLDATGMGLRIVPAAQMVGSAFEVSNSSVSRIAGLDIDGFDYAFRVSDCYSKECDIELSNNRISNSKINAVYLLEVEDVTISNNIIDSTGHAAISLFNADDNDIEGNLINRAFLASHDHNDASAILLQGNESCSLDRDNCNDGSSDNDIERNVISNTALGNPNLQLLDSIPPSAIRIYQGWENEISENTFSNNIGISIDSATGPWVGTINPNDGAYNKDFPQDGIDFPTITDVTKSGNTVTVKGFVGKDSASAVFDDFEVEIYQGELNSLGQVQGSQFLHRCDEDDDDDSVQDFDDGQFECSFLLAEGVDLGLLTAIAIDDDDNTSEFGSLWFGRDYDYGDAPNEDLATGWEEVSFPVMSADNGARHAIDEDVCLYPDVVDSCAFSLDEESDGQPSRDASLDEGDDGVEFNPNSSELVNSELNVLVTSYFDGNQVEQPFVNELVVTASENGYVSVWVDKNQDGSWDGFERNKQLVSEKVIDAVSVNAGENKLNLVLSAYDVHGESWVRVRYSTDQNSVNNPKGVAVDGEVEDYQVWIAAPSMGIAGCEAGLQNGSFEIFYTEEGHNGWDTPESSVAGWSIYQQDPTLDPHSQPFPQRRNHIEFNTYSAYVYSKSSDGSMNVAEMNVYHPTVMYQDVVTVPGERIRWSFDYSNRTYPDSYDNDQISLMFGSPDQDLVTEQVIDGKDYWVHHSGSYQVPAGQFVTRIAFKGNKPVGGSAGNILDNAKFGCEVGLDFGDLPKDFERVSNNKAELVIKDSRKVDPNLYIGTEPADVESEAKASAFAKGDDADGFNDEFTFSTPLYLTRGDIIEIKGIPVKNTTGRDAVLKAYLDVNGDSKFDDGEETSVNLSSLTGAQEVDVSWDLSGASFTANTQTFLRLELTGTGDLDHIGEIEDHLIYLVDDNIFPEPGRCDGFVQVKETGNNGVYQYAKWKAEGGEIVIDEINGNLNVSEIKAIGVSQADGMTYGVGAPSGNQHELYIASQEPNAEFTKVTSIKAAFDGVYIESSKGHRYTFNAGDTLDAKRTKDHSNKDKLGRANAGDVSPDGRYMLISRASWRTIVRIDLATGTFDTIQLKLPENSGAPWSADFAFDLSGESPGYVYGLAKNLQQLYKISVLDGSYSKLDLNILLPNGSAGSWPKEDQAGKLASGGFGINKGGILFAMTNGGLHDLNQDGVIDDNEKLQPSTALYSVDIANHIIHFEMKGEEETTTSNDAGGCSIHADYGDVPAQLEMINQVTEESDPAIHLGINQSIKLGSTWSADLGPGYDELASSDLSDDGVVFKDSAGRVVDIDNAPLIPGKQYSLYLNVSGGGSFTAWVSWDAQHWNELPTGLDFTVPMDSSRGYVRVRYSSIKPTTPYGEAPDGEVEDYSFEIGSAVKGLSVNAPSSPLTCEVAQYQVTLDVEGGNLSQDVNVNVGFENAPSQCWFDASAFNRGQEFGKALCSTGSKTLLFQPDQPLTRTIWVATDSELDKITLVASEPELGSVEEGTFFVKTGFKIVPNNVPAHYKAGETFGLRVERKVALDDEPQCITDPDYEGAKTFNFAYETDTHKGKLFLDKAEIGDSTPVTLNFSSGVSDEISSEYFESGYLNVLAEYTPEQGDTKSASLESPLHFKPYSLVVSDVSAGEVSNPADSLSQFIPAETEFSVQVTAVAKGHTASEPLITKNFDAALANTDGFLANVVVPSSQAGAGSDLSPNVPNTKVFSQGRLENTFEYGNVGTISTHWSVDSYDGYSGLSGFLNTQQSVKNGGLRSEIGYFYPAKFSLTSEFSVPTTRADNGEPWTYYGRSNVNVALEINALGANDSALSFYDADVLEESELPSLATSSFYFNDDLPTCLNDQGVLLDSSGSPIDFAQQWQVGHWSLVSANYYFGRAEDCWQQLDDASLLMDFTAPDNSLLVDDNGTILENEALALGQNIDVRFGRLTLVDVAGPTNQRLPVAVNIEYWDGEGFMANDWHSEPALSVFGAFPELNELAPQPMELNGAEPVIMEGSLELNELTQGQTASLIGGSEPGRVALPWAFSQGAENWLGYCWYTIENEMEVCGDVQSYQQPPISTATFGVSRGSDNVIYIMERFE
ncbi:DUF6701 domain-containing protein [Vibrio sp. TBV020]|uniref:DUF6701 domain-containing protein n=1 Tax=Vibrio sp. TBV020 TaxID=3137398 RepID=UPI0038CD8666